MLLDLIPDWKLLQAATRTRKMCTWKHSHYNYTIQISCSKSQPATTHMDMYTNEFFFNYYSNKVQWI